MLIPNGCDIRLITMCEEILLTYTGWTNEELCFDLRRTQEIFI